MRLFVCLLILLSGLGVSAAELRPQREKIENVLSGRVKEARASWWGYDAEDTTKILQAALDSKVPKLIIDAMPTPWITEQIYVHSDQEILFEKGSVLQAKRGSFRGRNDCLVNIVARKNVSISGEGAVIRMWGDDYRSEDYSKAEWRHAITILSSENVKISDLTITDTGGDAIYIDEKGRLGPCKNIHITGVICDGNHRNGISVISVEKLLIEKTIMKNTRGTDPECGIDFEPDGPEQSLIDCVVRDCITEDNVGNGYSIYLVEMDHTAKPVSIRFENCISRGDGRLAFLLQSGKGKEKAVTGKIDVIGGLFEKSQGVAIHVQGKPLDGIELHFDGLHVKECGSGDNSFPIQIVSQSDAENPAGKIRFDNVTVMDSKDRLVLDFKDRSSAQQGGRDISGTVELVRDGKTVPAVIDDSWLKQHFPKRNR